MFNYDLDGVYDRIEEAWLEKGFKNAHQFCESTRDKGGQVVTEQAISRWRKGALPDIKSLTEISKACDVSLDYLLGNEECKNHKITDIQRETGLSEKAINIITFEVDVADFATEEAKQRMRTFLKARSGGTNSWFIEHGLFNIIHGISADFSDDQASLNTLLYFLPNNKEKMLYRALEQAFILALKVQTHIHEREFEYIDRIAEYFINCGMETVYSIQKAIPNNLIAIQYTFDDLDDYVEYEADDKNLSDKERKAIANVSEILAKLSFDYFQRRYELQLSKQIAVNEFSDLLNKYEREYERRENAERTTRK